MPKCSKCNWELNRNEEIKVVSAVEVYHKLCYEQKKQDSESIVSAENK